MVPQPFWLFNEYTIISSVILRSSRHLMLGSMCYMSDTCTWRPAGLACTVSFSPRLFLRLVVFCVCRVLLRLSKSCSLRHLGNCRCRWLEPGAQRRGSLCRSKILSVVVFSSSALEIYHSFELKECSRSKIVYPVEYVVVFGL